MIFRSLGSMLLFCVIGVEARCRIDFECLPMTMCMLGSVPTCQGGMCGCSGQPDVEEKGFFKKERRAICHTNVECMLKNSCFVGPSVCENGQCTCTGGVQRNISPALKNRRMTCTDNRNCLGMLCFVGNAHCSNGVCHCP